MKVLICIGCFLAGSILAVAQPPASTRNIFIITTDGFRWQEVFKGADSLLIRDTRYVKDTALLLQQYWDDDIMVRRRRLLPFFWGVIARQGQLSGNRDLNNEMNVANLYKISYPGYNEIFTGYADSRFIPNLAVRNRNSSILGYLNGRKEYRGKVAAFSSWNVFPFILDEAGSRFPVNSGYELLDEDGDSVHAIINQAQRDVANKGNTRHDQLTFATAKAYIEQHHPRILFLGLGETDESAHMGAYDRYLQKAHQVDEMIAELWYYVQTDPFYKNNTTFIITTDHGRGAKTANWQSHGFWIRGSGQTWMAMLGQGIEPAGELAIKQRTYQSQIAATVSRLLGENFTANHPIGQPIDLPNNSKITGNPTIAVAGINK